MKIKCHLSGSQVGELIVEVITNLFEMVLTVSAFVLEPLELSLDLNQSARFLYEHLKSTILRSLTQTTATVEEE